MTAGKTLIPSAKVREILGISESTLYRYQRQARMQFPKPFRLNGRLLWDADEVHAFIETLRDDSAAA